MYRICLYMDTPLLHINRDDRDRPLNELFALQGYKPEQRCKLNRCHLYPLLTGHNRFGHNSWAPYPGRDAGPTDSLPMNGQFNPDPRPPNASWTLHLDPVENRPDCNTIAWPEPITPPSPKTMAAKCRSVEVVLSSC